MEETVESTPLPLVWDGNSLSVTDDDALHEKVDRKLMSPSTSRALRGCPSRYVGERLMPRVSDPFSPPEIGTSAHTVFERLFEERPEDRTEDRALEILDNLADEMWRADENADRVRWTAAVIEKVTPLFLIEDPTKVDLVRSEEKVITDVDGVPFIGFIDRVDKDEHHNLRVVDYKTGRYTSPAAAKRFGNDDEGDQMRLYALAYAAKNGELPTAASLHYTGAGKARSVPLTTPAMVRTSADFKRQWNNLKKYVADNKFPTKTSALCGWCPLVNSCPAAKAEGRTAKIDALSASSLGIKVTRTAPVKFDALADLERHLEESNGSVDVLPESVAPELDDVDLDVLAGAGTDEAEPADAQAEVTPLHPTTSHVHVSGDSTSARDTGADTEVTKMLDNIATDENKPWVEAVGGALNPNSYAAMGVFGVVTLAVEQLDAGGLKVTPRRVRALAHTLASVALGAQERINGTSGWADGLNTRVRGALYATLKTMPLPLGGDDDDWTGWVESATRRCVAVARVAGELYERAEDGYDEDVPWASLVDDKPADPWPV